MAKIYVASSWRNSYQRDVVSFLRNEGHEVYDFTHPNGDMSYGFSWSSIDPNWKNWSTQQYREALNHPIAQKGFDLDFNAMKWADVCVMVLPCGRSANTEAGWMKGAGKRVMVYSPKEQEPELMYKIYDFISDSMFRINDETNKVYSENQDANTSGNLEEMEERFCLVLEHATLGSMSRSNYDLETMKSVIDDAQQNHYYGVVKSDLELLIKDGGTIEDLKDYIKRLE